MSSASSSVPPTRWKAAARTSAAASRRNAAEGKRRGRAARGAGLRAMSMRASRQKPVNKDLRMRALRWWAWLLLLPSLAAAQPAPNRVYALEGAAARIPLPAAGAWEARDEAGRRIAATDAASPGDVLPVPAGGWYRLYRDGAPRGGRFAAGHVVLVTGQS